MSKLFIRVVTRYFHAVFTGRQAETRESKLVSFIDKVAEDVYSWHKHLLSGVTLRSSFLRSRPKYCSIYDANVKECKIELSQAILYVRKLTVSENVYSVIETTLLKTPAIYRNTEIIPKHSMFPKE